MKIFLTLFTLAFFTLINTGCNENKASEKTMSTDSSKMKCSAGKCGTGKCNNAPKDAQQKNTPKP